jgi:hypothetical protein
MWTTEYGSETAAEPGAVWAALRDLHSGKQLSDRSDTFELHGPFEQGTEISVTPQGQDTFRSRIIELAEPRVYADQTEFGDLQLTFRHLLTPLAGGGTKVTHQLAIDGASADVVGPELGPQISEDFPVAMADLFSAALQRSAS